MRFPIRKGIAMLTWAGCLHVASAQTTNGPVIGLWNNGMDASVNTDYRSVQGSPSGIGASLGYFVGGSPWRSIGFRAEFSAGLKRYTHDFRDSDASGTFRTSIAALRIPAPLVVRVVKGVRLMAGPDLELRFSGNYKVEGTRSSGAEIGFSDTFSEDMKPLGFGFVGGLEYRTKGALAIAVRAHQSAGSLMKKETHRTVTCMDLGLVLSFDILGKRGWSAPGAESKPGNG